VNENLIIVGKNSYIGGYLSRYVAKKGGHCISISSEDCNFLRPTEISNFFSSLDGRPYTIIFLAAVVKHTSDSAESFFDNLSIVKNLIDYHKQANIDSIIYFSSTDVYGRNPTVPIREDSKIDPATWYGLAKYNAEWMLSGSGDVDCPVTFLRLPGIYGNSPNERSFIGNLVRDIRNTRRLVINGTGSTLRDYVYIDDLCRILELLVPLRFSGVLNVATGQSQTISDIADLVGKSLNLAFERTHAGPDEWRGFDLTFDTRTLKSLFPDFRFSDLEVGIGHYL